MPGRTQTEAGSASTAKGAASVSCFRQWHACEGAKGDLYDFCAQRTRAWGAGWPCTYDYYYCVIGVPELQKTEMTRRFRQ